MLLVEMADNPRDGPDSRKRKKRIFDSMIYPTERKYSKRLVSFLFQKLKTIQISPSEVQSLEAVECSITQHFAYLHGVLQNIERKMIDQLYERRACFNKNLVELESQLRSQQDRLQAAILMAANAKDNFERTDMEEVVYKLNEIADVPCHLVQETLVNDEKILFEADRSIIDILEKHCTLRMPSISEFNLLRTELLPENYQVEPLTHEIARPTSSNSNNLTNEIVPISKRNMSTSSLCSSKSEYISRTDSAELVTVIDAVDPSWFYVRPLSDQKQQEELSKNLQVYALTASPPITEVSSGEMYLVECKREKIWRRVRIIRVHTHPDNQNNTCDILYVDVGHSEMYVPITRLRLIASQFAAVPITALRCCLYDVVANGGRWSNMAAEEFRRLVKMHSPFTMHLFHKSGITHYVDLCFNSIESPGDMISMRDTFVFMEYGNFVSLHRLMRTNPLSVHTYFREELEMETYVDVVVQCVISPECIYVTKIGENQKYVNKLMKDMTVFYGKNASSPTLACPIEIGIPCAILHLDGLWYRGIITEVLDAETVNVFCVDFGYSFVLCREELRRLTINYISGRTQAIQISLKDLKPLPNEDDWNTRAIDFIQKYLTNQRVKVIAMHKTESIYNSYVYIHGKTNFNTLLVNKGFFSAIGATSLITPSSTNMNTSTSTNTSTSKKHRPRKKRNVKKDHQPFVYDQSLTYDMEQYDKKASNVQTIEPDPFKVCVQVHQARSPDCIYVSDVSREEANMKLMAKMQSFYAKFHSQEKIDWTENAVCVVYSKKDKNYLRARILEIISQEEVLVFFYDMAIEEVISMKDIQPLHSRFQQQPAYLFKVKLAGILPCGGSSTWPTSSCQKLSDIINEKQNCQFYITKVADTEDSTEIPVQLWVKQSRPEGPLSPTRIEISSVNKMLVEAGLALPVKGYDDKTDKILAVEFKRQLQQMQVTIPKSEENVQWFSMAQINSDSSDTSSQEEEYSSATNVSSASPSQNITDWLPALPMMKDHFIAIPTYVDHDGIIYLHPKRKGKFALKRIESALNDFYKKVKIRPCDREWKEGDICIAQYHVNKKWYRAKVLRILPDNKIEVQFVDYGNIEECVIGTIKKRIILGHIPIQCTRCVIYGLNPNNEEDQWNTEDLDKIHKLLVENECEVSVLERRDTYIIVSITLLQPKKCDLISYLVNELEMRIASNPVNLSDSKILNDTNCANISTDSPDVIIEKYTKEDKTIPEIYTDHEIIMDNIVDIDQVISGSSMLMKDSESDISCTDNFESLSLDNTDTIAKEAVYSTPQVMSIENLANYVPLVIPNDIDMFEAELCCSVAATTHYIQLAENVELKVLNNYYNQYNLLMKDMQKDAVKQPLIQNLVPNTPCCALFADNVWYRCVILQSQIVKDKSEVVVSLYYVDFGNEEDKQVPLNNSGLHTLKGEWLSLPTMAIKCQLWHVNVSEDIDILDIAEELDKMYRRYNKYTVVKIKERYESHLDVELYVDRTCKKLLYRSLIKRGFLQIKKTKED
ncbi:hypothetical protein KPH14_007012 [Odynerus spinipes]|uniref:Tudor domain-containing protein n=1 Tax=Odynerus spinipes TaxID=1348599 RepID=A0AAD9RS15_9HYME|nr:hypothetical protein KPH14_007012 [Odynerus spinipes]